MYLLFEEVDLLDYKDLRQIFSKHKPDIVVHYAAINGTEYFYEKPWPVVHNNIAMTINLLNAIEDADYNPEKIIYASSSEVYGENPKIPTKEEDLIALDIRAVRDSYASSKAIGEFLIKNFCTYKDSDFLIF